MAHHSGKLATRIGVTHSVNMPLSANRGQMLCPTLTSGPNAEVPRRRPHSDARRVDVRRGQAFPIGIFFSRLTASLFLGTTSAAPSGREICRGDVNPIGMQRPVTQTLRATEFLLGKFSGLILVRCVDFHYALADLALAAVFAKYVFHEPNNKPRHVALLNNGELNVVFIWSKTHLRTPVIQSVGHRQDAFQPSIFCRYWRFRSAILTRSRESQNPLGLKLRERS